MNEKKLQFLHSKLNQSSCENYPHQSRIHRLRSFPGQCFVKRDDELGFGISGSKFRKFRSLIYDLKQRQVDTVILIGGASSNNVLGLSQLLIENGMSPLLFLLSSKRQELKGTHLFIRLFVKEEQIHWITRNNWQEVEQQASLEAQKLKSQGKQVVVIPEGSVEKSAIPGAASLALDILRNEQEEKINFAHIFLDLGTGFQAAIVMLIYAWLEKSVLFHLVLLADQKEEFEKKLLDYHQMFEGWLENPCPFPQSYQLNYPIFGKSFGSIKGTTFDYIAKIARQEGFLVDPIYAVKLFETARHLIVSNQLQENALIVHSGGGLALSGFQDLLAKNIRGRDGAI